MALVELFEENTGWFGRRGLRWKRVYACRHTLTQSLTTPLITPTSCVRAGVQCAARTSAPSPFPRSVPMTTPSSLYVISSPGRLSSSACTVGGSDHGGPPDDAGLCVGNSRQMRTPSLARSCETRAAQRGRREGGRAQRNYTSQALACCPSSQRQPQPSCLMPNQRDPPCCRR